MMLVDSLAHNLVKQGHKFSDTLHSPNLHLSTVMNRSSNHHSQPFATKINLPLQRLGQEQPSAAQGSQRAAPVAEREDGLGLQLG